MRRIVTIALCVVLALVVAVPMALGQTQTSSGNSLDPGQLSADWWKWALQKPADQSPLVGSYSGGPQCQGQRGGVFFLAGTLTGEPVTRECTVPSGTPIFFPLVNTFSGPDERGTGNEQEHRQFVNDCIDQGLQGSSTFVTVDGNPVSGQRAESPPGFFTVTIPGNNVFGAPPGAYDVVSDGVWVLLPPLSEGTHTIHFGGSFPNYPEACLGEPGGFTQDNTYILTVK